MAIYTQFVKGDAQQVASNMGWNEFGAWIETQKEAPYARQLWATGLCDDIKTLRKELVAMLERPAYPMDKDIESVLDQLLHNIDGAGGDMLLITNGVDKE